MPNTSTEFTKATFFGMNGGYVYGLEALENGQTKYIEAIDVYGNVLHCHVGFSKAHLETYPADHPFAKEAVEKINIFYKKHGYSALESFRCALS